MNSKSDDLEEKKPTSKNGNNDIVFPLIFYEISLQLLSE